MIQKDIIQENAHLLLSAYQAFKNLLAEYNSQSMDAGELEEDESAEEEASESEMDEVGESEGGYSAWEAEMAAYSNGNMEVPNRPMHIDDTCDPDMDPEEYAEGYALGIPQTVHIHGYDGGNGGLLPVVRRYYVEK